MDCNEISSENDVPFDWNKCFICQEFIPDDALVNPEKQLPHQKRDGLKTLAEQIEKFNVINEIPNHCVRVRGLDEQCLKTNHAKYHIKCSLKFNQRNLETAQKRAVKKEKKRQNDNEGEKLVLESPKTRSKAMKIDIECTSPPEEKKTGYMFFIWTHSKLSRSCERKFR